MYMPIYSIDTVQWHNQSAHIYSYAGWVPAVRHMQSLPFMAILYNIGIFTTTSH